MTQIETRQCWTCETTDSAEWWTDTEHTLCTRCAAKGDLLTLGETAETTDTTTYTLAV